MKKKMLVIVGLLGIGLVGSAALAGGVNQPVPEGSFNPRVLECGVNQPVLAATDLAAGALKVDDESATISSHGCYGECRDEASSACGAEDWECLQWVTETCRCQCYPRTSLCP